MNTPLPVPAPALRTQLVAAALLAVVVLLPLERHSVIDILAVLAVGLMFWLRRDAAVAWRHLAVPLLLVAAAIIVGLLYAEQPARSFVSVRELLRAGIAAVGAHILLGTGRLQLTAGSGRLAGSLTLAGLLCFFAVLWLPTRSLEGFHAALMPHMNPNTWGLTLGFATVVLAWGALAARSPWWQRAGWLALAGVGLLAGLLLEISRAGSLATLVALAVLVAFACLPQRHERILLAALVLGWLALANYYWLAGPLTGLSWHHLDQLSSWRFSIQREAWAEFTQHWLTGNGTRSFYTMVYQPFPRPVHMPIASPHNLWLEALHATGVVGTLLLLAGFTRLWRQGVRVAGTAHAAYDLRVLGYALLTQQLVHGMFDFNLFSASVLAILLLAILLASARHAQPTTTPP